MDLLKKYLGLIIEVIGVLFLIIPKVAKTTSNATLLTGGILMVVGVLTYIIMNKRIK